jgi:MOB kinase activator 1
MWGLKGFDKDKAKTFRPKRNHRVGTKRYELHKYAQATLGTGNLHDAVTLPEGEDEREWLAVNTVDFFNEINLLYGVIAEFCTESDCPVMCAGPKFEYMWADGHTIKKPITVSAPRYVDFLMQWVQAQLDDEAIFPTEIGTDADLSTQSQPPSFLCLTPHVRVRVGVPFPQDFVDRVQNIFKRLFRVYAHIYYCHFERMAALGAEPHLNTCFKHYMYFVYEFNLIPNKQELAPLQELIDKLLERDRPPDAAASAAQPSSSAAPIAAELSRPGSGEQ